LDNLLRILRNLGPARIAVLVVAIVVLIGMFMTIMMRMSASDLSLLYGGLTPTEASEMSTKIASMNVPYELRGAAIFVPSDKIGELRLQLAGEGLVGSSTKGYEVFDESSGFGTTSLVQNINARRALEGELSRTISSLPSVKNARVHLVLAERKLFSREKISATASVTLNLGGRLLSDENVTSITHLVAASVPNLKTSDVTIVDTQGNLLSAGGSDMNTIVNTQQKMRMKVEQKYESSIIKLLERVVGQGRVSVQVTADLNFDKLTESEEIFDPERTAIRSQQTNEDTANSRNFDNTPAIGVTGNVPGQGDEGNSLSAENNEAGTAETVNYEITKKVRHFERAEGAINRLSVAVLVEGNYTEDGEYTPLSTDRLDKFASLIKTSIGYNMERGDSVEVIDMPFDRAEEVAEEAPILTKEDYFKFGEYALMLIGMFLVLFMIIRPIMNAVQSHNEQEVVNTESLISEDGNIIAADEEDITVEEMVDLEKVEGQVRASTVRKVVSIIDKYPEESMNVIRAWMNPGE
jgi:flagellar M-ring protein FliF